MTNAEIQIKSKKSLISRPPIVVIMGHIDHGKTTLLDTIRKTEVALHESGGITQHIGAYETERNGKRITFLDTPGHEAFGKMRSRGAKVADIAVLVVAADDGVKPQTKEALNVIRNTETPFVVAINKIDKPTADIERIKNELAREEIFLEGRGGTVPAVEISAKAGTGIDQLLETILLLSELEELNANQKNFASGVVVESHSDPKRGITSTLLVLDGTLKKNEYVVAGSAMAKTRLMENFLGESLNQASPSMPVVVVGFDELPPVGYEFRAYFSQKEAIASKRVFAEGRERQYAKNIKNSDTASEEDGKKKEIIIRLVIKADTEGSVEAIEHEIKKIGENGFRARILRGGAGDVLLDDVAFASSAEHPLIIAFKVGIKQDATDLAERSSVPVQRFDVIYEISDFLKKHIEALLPPEIRRVPIGRAKILKLFKGEAKNQVIGGRVSEGIARKEAQFEIIRRDNAIGGGKIENLQSGKISVSEIDTGQEFGALTNSSIALAKDDVLELFQEETIKRKL